MTICGGAQLSKAGGLAVDRFLLSALSPLLRVWINRNWEQWNISGVKRFFLLVRCWFLIFSSLSPSLSLSLSSAGERDVRTHSSAGLSLGRAPSSSASRCLCSPQHSALVLGLWWDSGRAPQVRKSSRNPDWEPSSWWGSTRSADHDRGNICQTDTHCTRHWGQVSSEGWAMILC